jgi:hypothetical protein
MVDGEQLKINFSYFFCICLALMNIHSFVNKIGIKLYDVNIEEPENFTLLCISMICNFLV